MYFLIHILDPAKERTIDYKDSENMEMLKPNHKEIVCQEVTQTRPFRPTAVSKESFFPSSSKTGHVGELSNLKQNQMSKHHRREETLKL